VRDNRQVVLGLNIMHPDSSACLYVGDELIGAVAQERLGNRVKHDLSFPTDCIKFLLTSAKIKVRDIDIVALARDPRSNRAKKLQSLLSSKRNITQAVSSYLARLNKSNSYVLDLANVIGKVPSYMNNYDCIKSKLTMLFN
jgi:carbamoyltransferase